MLRALRHLAAYGSTNKYMPVKNCKASGTTAKSPTEGVYFLCAMATMLMMTATVNAMDTQRWVCRIHLFQFNVTSSEANLIKIGPKRIRHTYQYLLFDHKKMRGAPLLPDSGRSGNRDRVQLTLFICMSKYLYPHFSGAPARKRRRSLGGGGPGPLGFAPYSAAAGAVTMAAAIASL